MTQKGKCIDKEKCRNYANVKLINIENQMLKIR